MNIEELKMVLETINNLAGGATDAAIWWIALHYGGSVLVHLAWVSMIGFVVHRSLRALAHAGEWGDAGRRVAEAWGAPSASFGGMSQSDRRAIDRAITVGRNGPHA